MSCVRCCNTSSAVFDGNLVYWNMVHLVFLRSCFKSGRAANKFRGFCASIVGLTNLTAEFHIYINPQYTLDTKVKLDLYGFVSFFLTLEP